MENTSMKYNGSGYYDETPYKAYQNMNTVKPGEIWETSLGKEYLILKNHGNFCTVLCLCDTNRNNECIEIVSRSIRYTNPAMVQYVFNTAFNEFIKAIHDDQYLDIMGMVAAALEVKINVTAVSYSNEGEFKALEAKCRELNDQRTSMKDSMEQYEIDMALMAEECNSLRTKLACFKELYDSLLDRYLGRGEKV